MYETLGTRFSEGDHISVVEKPRNRVSPHRQQDDSPDPNSTQILLPHLQAIIFNCLAFLKNSMSGVVANKRNTESKYVSVFADSRPDVDVTFSDELLSRPSDHFMVGVDNPTVSLNSLRMLETEYGYVLRFGAIRRPLVPATPGQSHYYNHAHPTGPATLDYAYKPYPDAP